MTVVVGLDVPYRWNGTYVGWGLLAGLAGLILYMVFLWYARRIMAKAGRDPALTRGRIRQRNRIVIPGFLVYGLVSGALSAIFDNAVFVLVFALMILMFCLLPYVTFPIILRRLGNSS